MSIKTLRKRIALVAVSALGVGLLSVAPASAAAGDLTVVANGVASTASRGIVSINGDPSTTDISTAFVSTSNYMSILSNGQVELTMPSTTETKGITVSGGIFTACTVSTATCAFNASQTAVTTSGGNNAISSLTVVPNAGSTQMVVTTYTSNTLATSAAVLTINVVSAATSGVYSAATSYVSVGTTSSDSNAQAAAGSKSNTDLTRTDIAGYTYSATRVPEGSNGYLGFYFADANGVSLPATNIVSASATGGCLVKIGGTTAINVSDSTTYGGASYVAVKRVTATKPYTCTVTVSVNGTAVGSRTFTLLGKVAKVEADSIVRAKASTTENDDAFSFAAYDEAGNALDDVAVSAVGAYFNSGLTGITFDSNATRLGIATGNITCAARGSYKFQLYATASTTELVKSPEYTLECAGSAVTYSAALDKATYVPGDIATLTITAKDATGILTHDYQALGDGTTDAPAIAGSNMTAVTAATSTDTFTNGVKTYKFVVGSTEGSYQMIVDLPVINDPTTPQAAVNVPYSIKASSTAVSNAEVLAAIVKLIASINKQIRALQKSLKK